MKKLFAILLAAAMILSVFAGCGNAAASASAEESPSAAISDSAPVEAPEAAPETAPADEPEEEAAPDSAVEAVEAEPEDALTYLGPTERGKKQKKSSNINGLRLITNGSAANLLYFA